MFAPQRPALAALALLAAACSAPKPELRQPVGETTVTSAPESPADVTTDSGLRTRAVPPRRPDAGRAPEPCPELLPSFLFEPSSAVVSPAQSDELRRLAACLATGAHRDKVVVAIGHTDAVGDGRANLALGLERALKVRAFLVAHGLDDARVIATSAGELSTATTRPGRRVDLVLAMPEAAGGAPRPAPVEPDLSTQPPAVR